MGVLYIYDVIPDVCFTSERHHAVDTKTSLVGKKELN